MSNSTPDSDLSDLNDLNFDYDLYPEESFALSDLTQSANLAQSQEGDFIPSNWRNFE